MYSLMGKLIVQRFASDETINASILDSNSVRVSNAYSSPSPITPIQAAVQSGDSEITKLLLRRGCKVNTNVVPSLLDIAIAANNVSLVRLLLETGVGFELEQVDFHGPMFLAL